MTFTFIDETGNTGVNIFDQAQPDFYAAALITKTDFDLSYKGAIAKLCRKLGVQELHAGELGVRNLDLIAGDLLKIFKKANARFFVSRVEKSYLVATKVCDTFFDSGENAAVAWHHYNVRPLRLMLAMKLSYIIDEETAKLFWFGCLMEKSERRALDKIPVVCTRLIGNVGVLPDQRSREIITDGLEWARDHPEAFQIHINTRQALQGHMPNLVAFANLMHGLENITKNWAKPIRRVTHDQQSEFGSTLEHWHSLFSNASDEEINWVGETYRLNALPESVFEIKSSEKSAGIQAIDVVLWTYKKFKEGAKLSPNLARLLIFVLRKGFESDFSYVGVEKQYAEKFGPILNQEISGEQMEIARNMQEEAERARLASVQRYEVDGLVPFMRGRDLQIEVDDKQ